MVNFWKRISNLGIDNSELNISQRKGLILFNQVLFVGFFASSFQILLGWQFIGSKSLIFLIENAGILVALWLNSQHLSKPAKRYFQILTYMMGAITTVMLGGSGYYHHQALLIFFLGLIMFDWKTEKFDILLGIPFVAFSFTTGELGLFGAPDFSDHEWIQTVRFTNLTSLLLFATIFTFFLKRVNQFNENKLSETIEEKEVLLDRLTEKTVELAEGNSQLEEAVALRTAEINEQKEELMRQNQEKELLLKEVHHRVKNNLQIIVSLINLQLHNFPNKEVEGVLRETQNRVHSMSLVHKKMYQSSNFESVQLSYYVEEVVSNISELNGVTAFASNINIDQDIVVDVERAIPVGLIFNEIITNFFKHAYSDTSQRFDVHGHVNENNQLTISYRDEGDGFPNNDLLNNSAFIGLQLIESLSEQLDGSFSYFNDEGAVYEIQIQL